MSGIRDLVLLKAEKELLKARLASVGEKYSKASDILERKKLTKGLNAVDPCATISVGGVLLSEFRGPQTKTFPAISESKMSTIINMKPSGLSGEAARIRQHYIEKTVGEKEVVRVTKALEENQKKKTQKKISPSSISSSKTSCLFPTRYTRGEFPCTIEHGSAGLYLSWVCPLENLDYEYYLPIFVDGLQCKERPFNFIASQACDDLLRAASGATDRIVACIPGIIQPLRTAMLLYDDEIMLSCLKFIHNFASTAPGVAEALLPKAKMFLVCLNHYINKNLNTGDAIDYGQRNNKDIGAVVLKAVEELEKQGGPNAFKIIKKSIPTYQSVI